MNILILSGETAASITDKQDGQHRLAPVPLTDGRYFLSADVLTDREPGELRSIGGGWPLTACRAAAVTIEFTAGHENAAAVPADIKHLLRFLVAHWYAQEVTASFSRYEAPERAVAVEPERAMKRKYTRRGKKNVGQA